MAGHEVPARPGEGTAGRLLRALTPFRMLGLGIGLVVAVALGAGVAWWAANGYLAGDTLTYWLAGHRLDVGHALYSVRPDDP